MYVGSDHWALMYVYNYTFLETLLGDFVKNLIEDLVGVRETFAILSMF